MGRLSLGLLVLMLLPAPALAQDDKELERIEALVGTGDYAGARASLERWWTTTNQGQEAASGTRARALLLRARLASDPKAAERDYLAIALGYPTSTYAPTALLRLGQALLATGDHTRAMAYLRRLVDDHPGSPERAAGLLWLARAGREMGNADAACTFARQGIQATSDGELVALFRREETASCPRTTAEEQAAAPGTGAVSDASPESTGRFAIQSGAFRQAQGAQTLAARLRAAGYQPRIVRIPGSRLLRVRVGRLPDAAAAAAIARRLEAAGFEAAVVSDADKEQPAS